VVSQPTVADTIAILRGLKERYEVHHGIRITDSALVAAATLSDRYISDRFLPDKAIDLVDEAAAKTKMEVDSMPAEVDQVMRRKTQLQIEEAALKKERDTVSKLRLEAVREEIADLEEESSAMIAQWKRENELIDRIREMQPTLESLRLEAESLQRGAQFEKVAEIPIRKNPGAREGHRRRPQAAREGPGEGIVPPRRG